MTTETLTAVFQRESDVYTSLSPELDVASQGASIEEATTNLIEALELFFESANPAEVVRRQRRGVMVTTVRLSDF